MKKIKYVFLILTIFTNYCIKAQYQGSKPLNLPNYEYKILHFGFTIGANIMDFGILKEDNFLNTANLDDIYSIENQTTVGFHLGPVINFHLGEYFDFRTLINLSFGQRNLEYLAIVNHNLESPILEKHKMKIASTYLEFPLLLKYKAVRLNNFRPYLIAGINPKYDLAAQKKIKESEMPKIRLKNIDIAGEIGTGLDFYLLYFKFSVELKYSIGTRNMVVYDNTQYTNSIKRMTSNVWMISFHFE